MLLETQLSDPRTSDSSMFHTSSLIDSGCTAFAFADAELVVKRFKISTKKLVNPRCVRLADGSTQATVTDYFTICLHLGLHSEIIVLYVTSLGACNPIILGMPWLQLHNPLCDWNAMTVNFGTKFC